tara:strand:- start:50 stop:463 length:414 start_codon:yes stop_codon:yes gene_type:complete
MKKVLVLCTGNSCRSQMAEGFLKKMGCDVKSAGVENHGINLYAVKVMRELSIDISAYKSKKIDFFKLEDFDILITVCDHAKEICPNIIQVQHKIHKSFLDPTKFLGSEDEKLAVYRRVRDDLSFFCNQFFNEHYGKK